MKVVIDGQDVEFSAEDKNLLELAKRANIEIPELCYWGQEDKGCCGVCVVDIDGKQCFACATKPIAGMNVTVTRDDLAALRRKRAGEYQMKSPGSAKGSGGCCCGNAGEDAC